MTQTLTQAPVSQTPKLPWLFHDLSRPMLYIWLEFEQGYSIFSSLKSYKKREILGLQLNILKSSLTFAVFSKFPDFSLTFGTRFQFPDISRFSRFSKPLDTLPTVFNRVHSDFQNNKQTAQIVIQQFRDGCPLQCVLLLKRRYVIARVWWRDHLLSHWLNVG